MNPESRCDYRENRPPRCHTFRNGIGLTAPDWPVRTCFPRPCKAGPERVAKALFRDRPDLIRTHPGPLKPKCTSENAPVAQLDRAPDYESGGQEFESLRARQIHDIPRHRTMPRRFWSSMFDN